MALDHGTERIFGVTNLTLDGNKIKQSSLYKLQSLLGRALYLQYISFKKCGLEDAGLPVVFEALSDLKRLKEIDFSCNNIFDRGLQSICPFIGCSIKQKIRTIKFDQNEISDIGFQKLLHAIEENVNMIRELGFAENQLSDTAATYLVNFLKNIRMQDVEHSMNILEVDLTLNKILFKTVKEVEVQLAIN